MSAFSKLWFFKKYFIFLFVVSILIVVDVHASVCRGKAARGEAAYNLVYIDG